MRSRALWGSRPLTQVFRNLQKEIRTDMSNESSLGLMRIGLATADDIRRWSFGEVK